MLKKYINLFVIFITLFYFNLNIGHAYEFVNKDNESKVKDMINQIYLTKEQYEDLVGNYEETEIVINNASSTYYWWPVGSIETQEVGGKVFATGTPEATTITSPFGYRIDPLGRGRSLHSGVDIAGGRGLGQVNVIASRDGVVVYPTNTDKVDCPSSNSLSSCGGGYGNYVVIQHSDGNYTLYAHMYENSITVRAGESVKQGQVIGKMGTSGNSTGPHVHFEVRKGINAYSATTDPLEYISVDEPRKIVVGSTGSDLITFIHSWEGNPPSEGDYYIAFDDGYGTLTIGWGVVPKWHKEAFAERGVDISNLSIGSKVSKQIVDEVENLELQAAYDSINSMLAKNEIVLKNNQIDALVSRKYNYNVNGFANAYKTYGDTDALYENYMSTPIKANGKVSKGLVRRREAEWALFHNGIYQLNS